ncbi:MAG: LytTR family transcriptional regulator [Lachnospiraceae bacterium]|nr:LytTR family transcriptional regulator [Lachnospiraceae bacterium]
MQIKSEINEKYRELEVHVCHDRMSEEVRSVVGQLHALFDASLTGTDEVGNRCVIHPADVTSFYAEGQRVMARDDTKKYVIPHKLYELEKEYEDLCFVRISKSEIVNYKKIKSLDVSLTGTIKVIMKNGYETYTSRRNVAKLKELLLGGKKVRET